MNRIYLQLLFSKKKLVSSLISYLCPNFLGAMSTFLKRLKYYGIGFGMGLVIVFFFFQNRGCSWLPENRVKNGILDRLVVLSEQEEQVMKQKGITTYELINLLKDGDVDFGKSKKNGDLKAYYISNDRFSAYFTLPAESFISEIQLSPKSTNKVKITEKGLARILRTPMDENLIYVDTLPKLACQQAELGLINQKKMWKIVKKSAKIDFEKSHLKAKPKAEHYLWFDDQKGRKIGLHAIWYKNKINVQRMDLPFETGCN